MSTAPTHGGKRAGAGRRPRGGRTERLSVRLAPKLAARLRESGHAGELIESAFEFGDANQTGLTLSFLAEFARLGRRHWPVEGSDGTTIEDIPLDLPDAELREKWTAWHGDDGPAIEAAYRQYAPLAHRVRDLLLAANPLLTPADLDIWHCQAGATVDVSLAIGLLHGYGLIVNDGVLPCGGRSLVRFMQQQTGADSPEHSAWWITLALAEGWPDVAVAFGAGDYAVTGEAAVLDHLRTGLRLGTALSWWERNPEFCRRIDPAIEQAASIAGFQELAKLAGELLIWGSLFGEEPNWPALRAFRAAWWPLAARHGEDILLHLLERFNVLKADAVRHRLAIEIPGERNPSDYAVLGLAPGATRQAIDAAFRRLAQRHHPDKGGDAKVFIKCKAARELLLDRMCRR
jgi:hypothetical protein